MWKIKLNLAGRLVELWYGESGRLEAVMDVESRTPFIMSTCMVGTGITIGPTTIFGSAMISGAMVLVKDLDMLFPYYIARKAEADLMMRVQEEAFGMPIPDGPV